jgi:hypothetical protein
VSLLVGFEHATHPAGLSKVRCSRSTSFIMRDAVTADFVELLLKEDADPNFKDHLGVTPLMLYRPGGSRYDQFLLN